MICLLISCQKVQSNAEKDNTVSVSSEDAMMNTVIEEARATTPIFFEQMQKHEKGERDFSVKYPFETEPDSQVTVEHIWLVGLNIKDGKYYGTIGNEPDYLKNVKYMDVVTFDPKKISDWKYIKNDYLVGGKSIIYLMKNLSKEERLELLKQLDFKIKEFESES
jgi:uncharacterized protein YegJ (DUF2314 family)